jgi:hypothetical protein
MHNMNAAKQLSHTIKLPIIQPIFVRVTAILPPGCCAKGFPPYEHDRLSPLRLPRV